MKVLCVTEVSDRPESALIAGIAKAGLTVDVVCRADSPFRPLFEQSCHRVFTLDVRGRLDVRAARAIRKIVIDGGYDLVHAFTGRTVSAMVLGTLALGCARVSYRGTVGRLSRFDPTSWISFLAPNIDRTMCVSNAVRGYMIECGVPPERAVTVYKGHQTEWYSPATREAMLELGVAEGDIAIGCVATIRPVKGIDILLHSLKRIPSQFRVKLLLIGEVRDENVARLLGDPELKARVISVGHRRDATALVGACDIAVLPSREREGFPKSILEAMSLGRPVIASAVGGIPEILTDGVDGILVPPGDSESLARGLQRLIESPALREELGKRAKETVQGRFSVDRSVQELLALYRGIPELATRVGNWGQDSVSI